MEIENIFTYLYDRDIFDEAPEILIVRLNKLDEVEIKFLNDHNIIWRKNEGKIEILFFGVINYLVEYETNYEEGIYFKKTEEYYNYYEEIYHIHDMVDEVKNLIICKDRLKVEILISLTEISVKDDRDVYKKIFEKSEYLI